MWKGMKKALGHRSKAQKTGSAADVSTSSRSSAGAGLFPFDMADVDAILTGAEQKEQPHNRQLPSPAAAMTWAQLQQQLAQQHAVQQLTQQTEDSTSKRRAAAMQKRVNNSMLNPSTCLYQIKALLSLSTLFEHKLQRDTVQALQQQPSNLVSSLLQQALLQQQQHHQPQQQQQPVPLSKQLQQQEYYSGSTYEQGMECSGAGCAYCQGMATDSSQGSCCSCAGGGAASLRTPSATAASTAHVALQLASWGYRVIVRKVVHSKAYWTKSMDNTFIVALDSSSGNHVEYIVDPHFQEAFNVGVMSENYSTVWQALPRVFVGMPCQLQSAVQLLCEEMELSFLEAGRPCPPWRGWAATINRWMSDQFVDILVPEPGASSDEISEYMSRCTQLAAGGCGPGSSASGSTATRGSSTALSTCSPPGGTVSQQRLGDKVHVSSVLSSASAGQRRVAEPLQKQLGFVAEPEGQAQLQGAPQQQQQDVVRQQQQQQQDQASNSSGAAVAQQCRSAAVQQQQQQLFAADAPLERRSYGSSTSCCSSTSVSSSGTWRSGSGSGKCTKSLLTAQMQFRQQLQERQQQQQPLQFAQGTNPGVALQQGWVLQQQQQQQLLLMQQQQLLLQQLQQQGHPAPVAQQTQQLQVQQLQAQLLHLQQQQQLGLGGCTSLLPVVHTVRPCGAAPAPPAPVPAAAAAMHAVALQQLMPVQQRVQQQQQGSHAVPLALPQQQQQSSPQLARLQLQPSMHSSPEEQPKLLRLITRNKAA